MHVYEDHTAIGSLFPCIKPFSEEKPPSETKEGTAGKGEKGTGKGKRERAEAKKGAKEQGTQEADRGGKDQQAA